MSGQPKPPGEKRTLIVRSCSLKKEGSTNGRDWRIYELAVTNVAGEPIDSQFNSFSDLAPYLGKPTEYEVTFKDHETYGRTYTLKGPKRDYGLEIDDLRQRVKRLESGPTGQSAPAAPSLPGMPAGPPAAGPQSAIRGWDS